MTFDRVLLLGERVCSWLRHKMKLAFSLNEMKTQIQQVENKTS